VFGVALRLAAHAYATLRAPEAVRNPDIRPLMLAIGALLFFVSGFAALQYQVVWQRLLGIFSGADIQSATIIVAAFMAGLGCGSLTGGYLSDRLSRRGNLLMFASAELAVGMFGFFSAALYYDVLYVRFGYLAANSAAMPAILFLSLLWPTFLMGMALPLLARALTFDADSAARVIGTLYGANTFGAAMGALLTTWWLIPQMGLAGSLRLSAWLNVIVAVAGVPLAIWFGPLPRGTVRSARPAAAVAMSGLDIHLSFRTWAGLYGLSGFLALSLELIWFRIFGVMMKSSSFTFGTLLAVYLAGLGLGAAAGSRLARSSRRPARTFLFLQTAIGIYAGLSVIALLALLKDPASAGWLSRYLAEYEAMNVRRALTRFDGEFLQLFFVIPIVLIGPPTFLMGIGFPLLQKVVQTDLGRLGFRTGALMMSNIVGSTLGTVATGWLGLRLFGTAASLKAVVAASSAFALVGLPLAGQRRDRSRLAAAGVVIMLAAAMPDGDVLWTRLHSIGAERIIQAEDESGVSLLKRWGGGLAQGATVFADGLGQSELPYEGIHTILGALPAFVHPAPRDAVIIGLGSGDTVFGMAGRQEIERIVCVEIVRAQIETLRRLSHGFVYPGLLTVLSDPRIAHVSGDGRLFVMHAGRLFDIIEADALRPGSANVGNLYSDRYFAMIRDRLRPGGLAITWAPTSRVERTFVAVFPYVASYGDFLLGSRDPIVIDRERIRTRLADPAVQAYYNNSGVDIGSLLGPYIDQAPKMFDPSFDRSTIADINTDLFPRDEFDIPPPVQWWNAPSARRAR
jgi:spermidine synthase